MKTQYIILSTREKVLVDEEDYKRLSAIKWHRCNGYARTSKWENGKSKHTYMHRMVVQCPPDMEVDHINHNRLDNRKKNLRICTATENQKNVTNRWNHKSRTLGVFWNSEQKKWTAHVSFLGKTYFIGNFRSESEAEEVRNKVTSNVIRVIFQSRK